MYVWGCVRGPKNMYTFSDLLEELCTQKQFCSQLYFINTINRREDGLGWVWRNPGTDFLCSPPPALLLHAQGGVTQNAHLNPAGKCKNACNPGEPFDLQSTRFFPRSYWLCKSNDQPHILKCQISKRKAGVQQTRLGKKEAGSQLPAMGQPYKWAQLKMLASGLLC